MEVTLCQWYSACKNQIRSKPSSHITPSGMKGRFRHCVKTAEAGTNTKHERLSEKQEAGTMDREIFSANQWGLDRKMHMGKCDCICI